MARMKIFNTLEEEAFESAPVFNSAERKRFFLLPLMLKNSMMILRTPTNKVCFLVAAGYFKAQRKFFGEQFREADIEYVARLEQSNLSIYILCDNNPAGREGAGCNRIRRICVNACCGHWAVARDRPRLRGGWK